MIRKATLGSTERLFLVAAGFFFIITVPITSEAEEAAQLPTEVVVAAERGRTLFDEGRYQESIDVLEAAYDIHEEPIFYQYIGRCYQELERYCEAASNYRLFLENGSPLSDVRSQLVSRLVELDEQCRQQRAEIEASQSEPIESNGTPRQMAEETTPEPAASNHRKTDIIGAALMGVGGVGVVTGAILWVAALVRYIQLDNKPLERSFDGPWALSIPGDIITFSSLAMITAGALVFVLGRNRASRQVAFGPGPGNGLGFSFSLAFGSV